MSLSQEQTTAVPHADALDVVHRELVGIHYGLAEHAPTEPAETALWAMRELRSVLDYIQAVRKAQRDEQQAARSGGA